MERISKQGMPVGASPTQPNLDETQGKIPQTADVRQVSPSISLTDVDEKSKASNHPHLVATRASQSTPDLLQRKEVSAPLGQPVSAPGAVPDMSTVGGAKSPLGQEESKHNFQPAHDRSGGAHTNLGPKTLAEWKRMRRDRIRDTLGQAPKESKDQASGYDGKVIRAKQAASSLFPSVVRSLKSIGQEAGWEDRLRIQIRSASSDADRLCELSIQIATSDALSAAQKAVFNAVLLSVLPERATFRDIPEAELFTKPPIDP